MQYLPLKFPNQLCFDIIELNQPNIKVVLFHITHLLVIYAISVRGPMTWLYSRCTRMCLLAMRWHIRAHMIRFVILEFLFRISPKVQSSKFVHFTTDYRESKLIVKTTTPRLIRACCYWSGGKGVFFFKRSLSHT